MGTTTSKAAPLAPAFQRMRTWDLKTTRRVLQDYKDKDLDFGLDAQGLCELLQCDNDWAESILDAFGSSTGVINVLAFICGACIVSSGPALEKAELVFDALDFDSTEQISMDEMTIAFLCSTRGFCVIAGVGTVPTDEDLETTTLQAYRDLNKGSTQSISKSEFTKWVIGFASGAGGSPSRDVDLQDMLLQFGVIAVSAGSLLPDEVVGNNATDMSQEEHEETIQAEEEVHPTQPANLYSQDSALQEGVNVASSSGEPQLFQQNEHIEQAAMKPTETRVSADEPQEPATLEDHGGHESTLPDDGVLPIDRQCEDHFEPLLYVPEGPAMAPPANDGSHDLSVLYQQIEDPSVDSRQKENAMGKEPSDTTEENGATGQLEETSLNSVAGVSEHQDASQAEESYPENPPDADTYSVTQEDEPEYQFEDLQEQVPFCDEEHYALGGTAATEPPNECDESQDAYDDETYEAPEAKVNDVAVVDAPTVDIKPNTEGGEDLDYEQDFAQETPRSENDAEIAQKNLQTEVAGEIHVTEAAETVPPPSKAPSEVENASPQETSAAIQEDKSAAVSAVEPVPEAPNEQLDDDEAGARAILARRIRARKTTPKTPVAVEMPIEVKEDSASASTEQATADEVAQVSPITDHEEDQSLSAAHDSNEGDVAVAENSEAVKEHVQDHREPIMVDDRSLEGTGSLDPLPMTANESDTFQADLISQEATSEPLDIKEGDSTTSDTQDAEQDITDVAGVQLVPTTGGQKDPPPGGETAPANIVEAVAAADNAPNTAVAIGGELSAASGDTGQSLDDGNPDDQSQALLESGFGLQDGCDPAGTNPTNEPTATGTNTYAAENFGHLEINATSAIVSPDPRELVDGVEDMAKDDNLAPGTTVGDSE